MITKSNNHNHFWIENGILYESYSTIRGLRYRELLKVEEFEDTISCSAEEIEKINYKYFKIKNNEYNRNKKEDRRNLEPNKSN